MTAQTTTQRTAAHRRRMAEKMANLTEALEWAIADIEGRARYTRDHQFGHCLQRAKEALQGSATTQKPLDPTQRV